MLKFHGTHKDTGKPILGLGLSELNIQKLKQGMPILIDDKTFFDGQIIIIYGKTEDDIAKGDLKDFITPETPIRDDRSKHLSG